MGLTKKMKWKYHIIKENGVYQLGVVLSDKKKNHSWSIVSDTCTESASELVDDLGQRFLDAITNEVLIVKGNKLTKCKTKIVTKRKFGE